MDRADLRIEDATNETVPGQLSWTSSPGSQRFSRVAQICSDRSEADCRKRRLRIAC